MVYLITFLAAMFLLIGVHEYAHYIAARKLGIKVEELSIGFGPTLIEMHSKEGVKYRICALPIGGSVRMYEKVGDLHGKSGAGINFIPFNKQPLWKRSIVVLSGPVSNLLLSVVVLFVVGMMASKDVKPIIGDVLDDSWAASISLTKKEQIIRVNDSDIYSWTSFARSIIKESNSDHINIFVRNVVTSETRAVTASLKGVNVNKDTGILDSLGIVPVHHIVKPVVDKLKEGFPAYTGGVLKGDVITSLNEAKVNNWSEFIRLVQASDGREVSVGLSRRGRSLSIKLTPIHHRGNYVLGIGINYGGLDEQYYTASNNDIAGALQYAVSESIEIVNSTADLIYKLLLGKISITELSGPVEIAKITGESFESSLPSYLTVIATLSVSLFLINLLPIPMLDGGHLYFYLYEFLMGNAVSEKVQELLLAVGGLLICSLIIFVGANDIYKLFVEK